jgi:hypothetical protein
MLRAWVMMAQGKSICWLARFYPDMLDVHSLKSSPSIAAANLPEHLAIRGAA